IENEWIDAELALFDPNTLPDSAVSQDLFADKVLIERQAFLDAQNQILLAEQKTLTEDGWSEVVIGKRGDIQDRLLSMDPLPREYDAETTKKLKKIDADAQKLEKAAQQIDENDEVRLERLQKRFDGFEKKRQAVESAAVVSF